MSSQNLSGGQILCNPESLSVLLTIQTMEGPAGGSLYVRDFALELFRQGHRPSVYCPRLGTVSAELLQAGIPVLASLDRLLQPDIIHGNSPIETVAAMLRFPDAPAIFVCHGWGSPDALAPKLPRIMRYLAVSEHAWDSLIVFSGIPESLIRMHQNPVDLQRFPRRSALAATPRRALVLSNSLTEANHLKAIEEACAAAEMSLDVVGMGMGTDRKDPESILRNYDVVFAKGRSALEALATGCAVVLCDAAGFGELITTENYDLLRRRNFGLRTFQLPATTQTVSTQLKRYNAADAANVTERVRGSEGLFAATTALLEHYFAAIQEFRHSFLADWSAERLAVAQFLNAIAPTSNTFFLAQQLAGPEKRFRRAEDKLRRLGETLRMKALPPSELSRIRVHLDSVPDSVEPDATCNVFVIVENESTNVLTSLGDCPILLSYHWYGEDGLMIWEGVRSELYPPLPPGSRFRYGMQVTTPSTPGSYTLHLTLVQESVAWLDQLGVLGDNQCTVRVETSVADPPSKNRLAFGDSLTSRFLSSTLSPQAIAHRERRRPQTCAPKLSPPPSTSRAVSSSRKPCEP